MEQPPERSLDAAQMPRDPSTPPSPVAAQYTSGCAVNDRCCLQSTDAARATGSPPEQPSGDDRIATTLPPVQQQVFEKLVSALDHTSSVVITNPLIKDNPIVYVTKPWERMCGFSSADAVGRNPRLTQGDNSDRSVITHMSAKLAEQRSCRAMLLNYRGGHPDRPFWNMLSISPVTHSGQLMFYMANLQDYSFHMTKLVSLTPTQFCKSAEAHQHRRRIPSGTRLNSRSLATPAIFEADDNFDFEVAVDASSAGHMPGLQMKRLGWSKLELEPEHLADRIADCLRRMDASVDVTEGTENDDGLFVINTRLQSVAARILVSRDPSEPTAFRISCSRLGGDTFAYHEAFRQMRKLLGDVVENAPSLSLGSNLRTPVMRVPLGGGMGLVPAKLPAAESWGLSDRLGAQTGQSPLPLAPALTGRNVGTHPSLEQERESHGHQS